MKPLRAFLFLSSVLCVLFLVSFYRTKRSQEQLHSTLPQGFIKLPDTVSFIADQTDSASDFGNEYLNTYKSAQKDSIEAPQSGSGRLIFASNDSLRFSAINRKLFSPSPEKSQIRILYYGDSQIEGDHITSALRKSLQARYGGKGPGMIAPEQYYNPPHQLIMNLSDNWQAQATKEMTEKNKSLLFKNALATAGNDRYWFRINRLRFLNPQEDYNQIRLFLHCTDTGRVELLRSGASIVQSEIDSVNQLQDIRASFDQTPDDLKVSLTTQDSLWISAISLETKSGIFVDNISLRGHSYPPFSNSDQAALTQMAKLLQPDLFILQFGVNVAPYHSEDYHNFRVQFRRQIRTIQQICPDIPVLIIGISDMAHRVEDKITSYRSIRHIKQIQFELAMENHCAFWDLEHFMGGPGSMASWVDADPPLGRSDYIHFTEKGGDKIGYELAKIIISEFETGEPTAWKNN